MLKTCIASAIAGHTLPSGSSIALKDYDNVRFVLMYDERPRIDKNPRRLVSAVTELYPTRAKLRSGRLSATLLLVLVDVSFGRKAVED